MLEVGESPFLEMWHLGTRWDVVQFDSVRGFFPAWMILSCTVLVLPWGHRSCRQQWLLVALWGSPEVSSPILSLPHILHTQK